MQKVFDLSGRFPGQLTLDYLPSVNYAMVLNEDHAISRCHLKNCSEQTWKDVRIQIGGNLIELCQLNLAELKSHQTIDFQDANLLPVTSKLMRLTEAVQSSFTITVHVGETLVLSQTLPLLLMAFDQWHGDKVRPELVAAFVTPNHPCLAPISQRASQYLEKLSGDNSLDSYFSDDSRILQQIESVYHALLDEHLTFQICPASFEQTGQRIRLVDKVLNGKMANCIDLSLLLCSCLENIGIQTFLLLYDGHALMAASLYPNESIPMVEQDIQVVRTAVKEHQMVVVQAVSLTEGASFEDAVKEGEDYVFDRNEGFECMVNIYKARKNRIRPLPQSIQHPHGWEVVETPDYDEFFDRLAEQNPYAIHGSNSTEKMKGKQQLWERKLLDLSLRNTLLNMKSGKHIIPLKNLNIDEILNLLQMEELASCIEEKEDFSTQKELYRAARLSLEENGANTLFLAVGTMRWYEEDARQPHFAPIMFLPVEMVRHGARKYVIRPRDEEPLMNITLLEMMRQIFDLEIPTLSPIPEDEQGRADWRRVFDILNTSLNEVNERRPEDAKWQIVEECMIGIFSFAKFVMWNDIHSNPEVLENHPLLRSLMEGKLDEQLNTGLTFCDARQLDETMQPKDCALPVDVDSSQLEAVANSGRGNSFILYGPPGTGKSQTITNMIANALYHNKRVLFVAEKKAALEVVQERLKRIGLEPFCLELHSNKVDKKSFLSQMEMALDVERKASVCGFDTQSEELFRTRQELNGYVNALHLKRAGDLSLYEALNRYQNIEGEFMQIQDQVVEQVPLTVIEEICRQLRELDTVQEIIGCHPSAHPLQGLYPLENTLENQTRVREQIERLPQTIARANKKSLGWLNRLFLRRSAMEILQKDEVLVELRKGARLDPSLTTDIVLLAKNADRWRAQIDRLRSWYHFSTRANVLQKYKLPFIMEWYMNGSNGKATADALLKGYYRRFSLMTIDKDPALRSFNGLLFEQVIDRYRSLTDAFQKLTREELFCRLSQHTPRAESASKEIAGEITFLRKRIAGGGRSYTVRRMLEETRHILPSLCPCMLMSPLSVSQYLDMRSEQFDLVIFDEASQMPTSEAVCAIARGAATVIVGDPKQMPPTSFFEVQQTDDSDAEFDDLESILDDCISLSLPSQYLSWHYRSKHESLIAFSNVHYYDGRLITFPSVDDQERKVTLQPVKGIYDFGKTRSNKTEAKAVVDDIIARLQSQQESGVTRSIGVVAFSKVQSSLIEDMLTDALAKHPDLETLATGGEEPIFIKNLENVQGDERDIILFSIGYGPDKQGRVSMNFGPLNQRGGERRLNVAVSRARYEMKVFSSLRSSQIDLDRTSAYGVAGLKQFLEYAETGELPQLSSQVETKEIDPIVEKVAEQCRQKGYEVHTYVGRSRFKVDVAIVDPEHLNRYLKGIISDGHAYYETPTARDREIVQPTMLRSLGWEVYHNWTIDESLNSE